MKIKTLFLKDRFYYICAALIVLFVLSFAARPFFSAVQVLLILFIAVFILDIILLYFSNLTLEAQRKVPRILSLGDENSLSITLQNISNQALQVTLIDELPFQFQLRDFKREFSVSPGEVKQISYELKPTQRGEYTFGDIQLFVSTLIGLGERKISIPAAIHVPVYPSILQMKQMELRAFERVTTQQGIKRIRRIGHSYEFEQIKSYVRGDDYRSINWKASGRRTSLMVNQYEDERAQQVYCVIDKSRAMKMPFEGMSLMDYAINTTLVISNIALQKYDKAGLITFSDKIGGTVKADSKNTQLSKILIALYKEQQRQFEANYELLYYGARKLIRGRSLILLFTNFESNYALERVLPVLRKVNRIHLLVVVFFENTEIRSFAEQEVQDVEGIYYQTIAQKFLNEKEQMVQKLKQYGIQAILTKPEELSVNTINKYLELKSRGLI